MLMLTRIGGDCSDNTDDTETGSSTDGGIAVGTTVAVKDYIDDEKSC